MLILTIRTDKPEAELAVFEDDKKLKELSWQAHRELASTIHLQIESLLRSAGKHLSDIKGIVVYKGPGSFTGLRIGISTANAFAASLPAAIVAGEDDNWKKAGIQKLRNHQNDKVVVPEYGAPANITKPKK